MPSSKSAVEAGRDTETIAASTVEAAVAAINPDNLSPREALEALYHLKALATAQN